MHNLAFLALLAGVLLIYCEFIWVGKIFFGTAGALLCLVALKSLCTGSRPGYGLWLVAACIPCYALPYKFSRIAGTVLLAIGTCKLYPAPHAIPPALAIPACLIFGLTTQALLEFAQKARQNKRADL